MAEKKHDVKDVKEVEAARRLKDAELDKVVGGRVKIVKPKLY